MGGGDELLELLIGHLSKDAARRDAGCTPGAGEEPAMALTLESVKLQHARALHRREWGIRVKDIAPNPKPEHERQRRGEMCIGEWEEMGKVSRKSVSREVFLNLGMTQNRMGSGRASKEHLMAGEAHIVASMLSISQFQVSSHVGII